MIEADAVAARDVDADNRPAMQVLQNVDRKVAQDRAIDKQEKKLKILHKA